MQPNWTLRDKSHRARLRPRNEVRGGYCGCPTTLDTRKTTPRDFNAGRIDSRWLVSGSEVLRRMDKSTRRFWRASVSLLSIRLFSVLV